MKRISFLLLAAFSGLSVFATGTARADGRKEVFVNSLGFALGGASRLSFSPGYNHPIWNWMQIGAALNYQSLSYGDTSVSTYALQVGPNFNVSEPFETGVFASVGLAIRKGSGAEPAAPGEKPGGTGFYFFVGKRIPLGGRFFFRPNVGIESAGKSSIVANLLAISVVL